MQHEVKKITLIVNELITMMLLNGAEEVNVDIKKNDIMVEITLLHRNCHYPEEFIEKMTYNLNTQRQSEVEGYYWQLVGDDDSGEELHLVGAMIDEAKVEMKGKDLSIYIVRKKH